VHWYICVLYLVPIASASLVEVVSVTAVTQFNLKQQPMLVTKYDTSQLQESHSGYWLLSMQFPGLVSSQCQPFYTQLAVKQPEGGQTPCKVSLTL